MTRLGFAVVVAAVLVSVVVVAVAVVVAVVMVAEGPSNLVRCAEDGHTC